MAEIPTNAPKTTNGPARTFTDILSPKNAFAAWRSMMTLPAASMIEALRFGSRRLEARLSSSIACCPAKTQPGARKAVELRGHALNDYGRETEAIVQKVREGRPSTRKAA